MNTKQEKRDKMNSLSDRLKQLRNEKNMTMQNLADELGIKNSGTINNWEKGTRTPKEKYLLAYAKYFNVPVDWIKYGDYDEYAKNVLEQALRDEDNIINKRFKYILRGKAKKLGKNLGTLLPLLQKYFDDREMLYDKDFILMQYIETADKIIIDSVMNTIAKEMCFKESPFAVGRLDFDEVIDFDKLLANINNKNAVLYAVLESVFCNDITERLIISQPLENKGETVAALFSIFNYMKNYDGLKDDFLKLENTENCFEIASLLSREYSRETLAGKIKIIHSKTASALSSVKALLEASKGNVLHDSFTMLLSQKDFDEKTVQKLEQSESSLSEALETLSSLIDEKCNG